MQIIEWEPEHVMGAQIHDANLDSAGRVTFEKLGEATTRLTIESDFPGMDETMAQVIRPRMERTVQELCAA